MTKTETKERGAEKNAAATNLPATQGNGNAPAPNRLAAFKEVMDKRAAEIKNALPSHISPERFQRVVLTALQRNPDLVNCSQQTLWNSCLQAAADGLLPDGREGAIVGYKQVAQWMPMIEGLRKKARNSGEISDWNVQIARQKDHFKVVLGDQPRIEHEPYIGNDDPGEVVAAYSIAWLKDGTISRDVMTARDILKIKAKSKASNGPWQDKTFEPEMMKKTVARRHYKQLPHSSDLDKLMQREDEQYILGDRAQGQVADNQTRRLQGTTAALSHFAGDDDQQTIDHEADDQGGARPSEFADDEQKPGDGKKNDPISSGPQGGGKTEGDGKAAGSSQSDNDDRRWPNGAVPTDADEYEHYAETKIGDFQKKDADEISKWWKSKAEKDCGKMPKINNKKKAMIDI